MVIAAALPSPAVERVASVFARKQQSVMKNWCTESGAIALYRLLASLEALVTSRRAGG